MSEKCGARLWNDNWLARMVKDHWQDLEGLTCEQQMLSALRFFNLEPLLLPSLLCLKSIVSRSKLLHAPAQCILAVRAWRVTFMN